MKQAEEVLLFQFEDEEKREKIITILKSLKVTCRVLQGEAYKETIGALFGMKGIPKPAAEESFDFPHEVMLLRNIQGKRLDKVLDTLKEAGIPKIKYKAVVTPTNTLWTLARLCRNMEKEHGAM